MPSVGGAGSCGGGEPGLGDLPHELGMSGTLLRDQSCGFLGGCGRMGRPDSSAASDLHYIWQPGRFVCREGLACALGARRGQLLSRSLPPSSLPPSLIMCVPEDLRERPV